MIKKTINIIIIILVIIIVGLGSYYYFVLEKNPLSDEGPLGNLFPFGQSSDNPPPPALSDETTPTTDNNASNNSFVPETNGLRQISSEPVAGFIPLNVNGEVGVRYLEKATGHIFDASLESNLRIRKSNTTLAKVIETYWNSDGSRVVVRYLTEDNETIQTRLASLKGSNPSDNENDSLQELVIEPLDNNIKSLAVSPDRTKLAYFVGSGNQTNLISTNFDGSGKKTIGNLPISEWLLEWPVTNNLALTTKASGVVAGYSYLVGATSGSLSKTIGGILGLTTNYFGVEKILYSFDSSNLSLSILSLKNSELINLPVRTLPEKCVWSSGQLLFCAVPKMVPAGQLPDDWYMGRTSFNDDIWKIDLETGELSRLSNLENTAGRALDAVSLELSLDNNYLVFINRNDGSLWSLNLSEENS